MFDKENMRGEESMKEEKHQLYFIDSNNFS